MSTFSLTSGFIRARNGIIFSFIFMLLATGFAAAQSGVTSTDGGEAATEAAPDTQALIDLLKSDQAREALISELERLNVQDSGASSREDAGAGSQATDTATAVQPVTEEEISLSRRIAHITQEASEGILETAGNFWARLARSPAVFDGFSGQDMVILLDALKNLFLIIVSTVAIFVALRRIAVSLYGRMGAHAQSGSAARVVMMYIISGLIDAFIVILAWAAGYALALLLFGDFGAIGIRQTLYLNAFLVVELVKVGLRLLLSPSSGTLRLLPLGDRAARYLSGWLTVIVSILGYGQMLVVPILNANVRPAAGSAASALIAFAGLFIVVWLVLRNRRPVSEWMLGTRDDRQRPRRSSVVFLARRWHWFALAYLLVMFVIILIQPGNLVFTAFSASGQIIVAVLLGIVISGHLSRATMQGISLSEGLNNRLPRLETRLNAFVPRGLVLLRFAIIAMIAIFALDVLGLVDMRAWLTSRVGMRVANAAIGVFFVLLVAFAIWLALTSWVDYRLNPDYGKSPTIREQTLLTLLRSASTVALMIITLMFVLSQIGLNIGPLLASAGVVGLAIGFGAQKMVQDIITGVFIQLENAMNVGDFVDVGGTSGTVERLTIRSVSLRDVQGAYHIIPFSSVDTVTSYARDYGNFVCDMGVAYRENVDEVKQAMFDAFEELKADPDQAMNILDDELQWFGLNAFGDSAIVLRARIKCVAGTQWGVGRAYNAIIKRIFDERNIEIPFPHQTIYLGEAKDGSTQSFRIGKEEGS